MLFTIFPLSSPSAHSEMAWPVYRLSPFSFLGGRVVENIISEPKLDIFGTTAKKKDIEIEN